MPILKETLPECFIVQQDGTPCHFHTEVKSFFTVEGPIWIDTVDVIHWSPQLPDFSLVRFCVSSIVKDQVYSLLFPKSILELKL